MDLTKWLRVQADRVAAVACVLAGALVLLVGWIGVSSHAYPAEQLPYIASAGLGGMFLLGMGAVLWLSADLVDEWRKLDRLEQELRKQTAAMVGADAARTMGGDRINASGEDAVDAEHAGNPALTRGSQERAVAGASLASVGTQESGRTGSSEWSRG